MTPRRLQHFHYVDDGLAHVLQITRGPGIAIRIANHRRVFGQELGDMEQVGGVGQGFAGVDVEEWTVGTPVGTKMALVYRGQLFHN